MRKFKKVLLASTAAVMTIAVAIGGTIAYLTSEDGAANVMTLGNVEIEQVEQERDANGELKEFTQAKPAFPAVYETITWDDEKLEVNGGKYKVFNSNMKNVIDKIVTVENTGKSDAYVRTIVAIEAPNSDPKDLIHLSYNKEGIIASSGFMTKIDGVDYYVLTFTYDEALAPEECSAPSLMQLFLGKEATNEDCALFGDTWEVLVVSQAIQTKGFDDAATALNTGFGEVTEANVQEWFGVIPTPTVVDDAEALKVNVEAGKYTIMNADMADVTVATVAPYGNYYGIAMNGGVLDGNGKTLDFDMGTRNNNGKYDNYGIMTSGGTIKNIEVTGVFRGIMIMNPTETVYIDNVVLGDDDMCYAINTGEGDGTQDLVVTNSTIKGWSSYGTAIKSLSFKNCTFAQGSYYTDVYGRLVKPYVYTVFEDCEFGSMFYIDLSKLGMDDNGNLINPDAKIVLRNCTVNGVKLTADNWKDLVAPESTCGNGQISIELRNGTYLTATNIVDYVIFE